MQALKTLQRELNALVSEAKSLQSKVELASADIERMGALPDEIEAKKAEIDQVKRLAQTSGDADKWLNGDGTIGSLAGKVIDPNGANPVSPETQFEARRKSTMPVKFIQGSTLEDKQRRAYTFGQFMLATYGHQPAVDFCKRNGIQMGSVQLEGVPADGGFLVPEDFENDMIVLREQFGIFRQKSRYTPMSRDTKWRPRRTQGLTTYYVGEGAAATVSKAKWDRVQLKARKLVCLARWSNELGEDAMIEMGDTLAGEIAYAFASAEDDAGFNGDNTSTYGNINGVRNRLLDVYGASGGVGLKVGTGNAYSEIVLADFLAVAGMLPEYAETPNVAWYVSKSFWENVMVKLALASGGVPAAEIVAGIRRNFIGYPVIVSQKMPKTEANSQVCAILGDLALGSMFGDRRQTTIAVSDSAYVESESMFERDELAIRGTERFDINVHDVGDATNAGPIVGLITAAS